MLNNQTFKLQGETIRRIRAIREDHYTQTAKRISDDDFIKGLLDASEKKAKKSKLKNELPVDEAPVIESETAIDESEEIIADESEDTAE